MPNKIYFRITTFMLVMLILSLLTSLPPTSLAQTAVGWRDTGLTLPVRSANQSALGYNYCFDATQPNTLFVANRDPQFGSEGTYAYNWAANQRGQFSSLKFQYCNESTGLLFAEQPSDGEPVRFSPKEPKGRVIPYPVNDFLTTFASDGSQYVYQMRVDDSLGDFGNRLWVSVDGGVNWERRARTFDGRFNRVLSSPLDARSIYLVAPGTTSNNGQAQTYIVYFSPDAGLNWEARGQGLALVDPGFFTSFDLFFMDGVTSPVDTLILRTYSIQFSGINTYYVSIDGGRTFTFEKRHQRDLGDAADFFYTADGAILRHDKGTNGQCLLTISRNGGKVWRNAILPYVSQNFLNCPILRQAADAPSNFFYSEADGSGDLWYSADNTLTWQNIGQNMSDIAFTPYSPLTLIGIKNNRLYVKPMPAANRSVTNRVLDAKVPNGTFFPETGHNIYTKFKNYWVQYGGLAQFGLPRTEPLREISPDDGKIYLVQYFERNRFEYHPEFVGTRFEVLLGLLGYQLAEERRVGVEGPFNRVQNNNKPDSAYFNETGHHIGGVFRRYWDQYGGLAIFGYPLSEEFDEINPDDGKVYRVQYFERNRFELHAEFAGTRFEVLLGLLGNSLLKRKGWLPV